MYVCTWRWRGLRMQSGEEREALGRRILEFRELGIEGLLVDLGPVLADRGRERIARQRSVDVQSLAGGVAQWRRDVLSLGHWSAIGQQRMRLGGLELVWVLAHHGDEARVLALAALVLVDLRAACQND